MKGWRELFGSDAGQATLLQGLLRDSFRCLRLPTSVAHSERGQAKKQRKGGQGSDTSRKWPDPANDLSQIF